ADLLGGQVPVMFDTLVTSIEHIRSGRLRALAVTDGTRSEVLPNVPTISEFGPGYESIGWTGIGAPRNTSPEIIERIKNEISAGLADSRIKARIAVLGSVPMPMTPVDFAKFIVEYTDKWGKVIRAANIKAE